MHQQEDAIAQAERHVREGEERIARQTAVVEKLAAGGHERAADVARDLLVTLQTSQAMAQDHVRDLREGKRRT